MKPKATKNLAKHVERRRPPPVSIEKLKADLCDLYLMADDFAAKQRAINTAINQKKQMLQDVIKAQNEKVKKEKP